MSRELDSVILMGVCQLEIFYDTSIIMNKYVSFFSL